MENRVKPNLKDFFIFLFILFIGVSGVIFIFSKKAEKDINPLLEASASAKMNVKKYASPPAFTLNSQKKYLANLQTSQGLIQIELFAGETPKAVNNFVFLAREGFYDGTIFHRVIKNFMIQGGDPNGDGTGGPGYTFNDEKITRDYKRGMVAMANRGDNTNGSQFFIMHKDYDLPKKYVIFGQAVEGLDTIDKIAESKVKDNGFGEESTPVQKITLEKVTVIEQ